MTNSNHLAPSAPLFAQLNILDIFKVNSFYIAKFMFSYHQRLLPSPFLNLFPTGGQIHNYDTRTSAHFRPHTCRTNIKQFTILYRGPKIWNALPLSIASSPSLSVHLQKKASWFPQLIAWNVRLCYVFIVLPPPYVKKSQYNVFTGLKVPTYLRGDLSV